MPSDANPPGGPRRDTEREGGAAVEERKKVERPQRFKVILFNDDYTRMEFVVTVLEQVFALGPAQATQLMLRIHRSGHAVAGIFVLEVAETKSATVHRLAEENGYPLRAGIEPE